MGFRNFPNSDGFFSVNVLSHVQEKSPLSFTLKSSAHRFESLVMVTWVWVVVDIRNSVPSCSILPYSYDDDSISFIVLAVRFG